MNDFSTTGSATSIMSNSIDERAELIGRVVWALVREEAKKTTGRSIHLLAGFRPEHLAGISRMMPADLAEKAILAIRKDIDAGLTSSLPAEHLTDRPAVHYRNSDEADIILVAVSDAERETVGASLNPVSRIDRNSLQQMSELWRDEILAPAPETAKGKERRDWIAAVLEGLNRSEVTKELDQFAEFVRILRNLANKPWEERIRLALPAFRIPINATGPIPNVDASRSDLVRSFRNLFRSAERETAGYSYFIDKNERPIDPASVLTRLEELGLGSVEEEKQGFAAIRALVADARNLRPGDWRKSQEAFCNVVNWKTVGTVVFDAKKRKKSSDLSDRTREYLNDEYADDIDDTDIGFLDDLKDKATTPEDDDTFFERWQDRLLAAKNRHLYEAWRRHLFSDEIRANDLQVAILRGVQTLLMKTADADGTIVTGARIRLTARHGDRLSTWSELDERVYALFRLDGQLLAPLLSPHIKFDFGRWLDPKAIEKAKGQKTKDSRQIEFEMFLVNDGGEQVSSARIRVFWQPGHTSIALAWPADIEALYQGFAEGNVRVYRESFALKPGGEAGGEAGAMPATLADTESFVDVTNREVGRTASPAAQIPGDDVFARILDGLNAHEDARELSANAACDVRDALLTFRAAFGEAIKTIHKLPSNAYEGDIIERQASAFGDLCRVAQLRLQGQTSSRRTTMAAISEFGIVTSGTGQEAAIIPAWHPLRLLERKAKAREMARFIAIVLDTETVSSDGLERSCADREQLYSVWFYPEVVSIGLETFAAIEHCGGYSFAIPVSSPTIDLQDLESTAAIAVREYAAVADRYLALNPHEEGNFSTAIFNADTISLPAQVASELERRMARQPHLRCSLLITHDDPDRMRRIYAQQNARLRGKSIDEITEGFLSRLRVGVGKGDTDHGGRRRSSIDIVFLHDAIYRYSEPTWNFLDGASDTLPESVDFRNALMPRRKSDGSGKEFAASRTIELALSTTHPPRACAAFLDLCFAANKDERHIPEGRRALPVRRVSWESDQVRRTIERAHDLGEWVVTVDSMASRQMFADSGIKVIRDIALIDSEMRVLVSSREPSDSLRRYMVADFEAMEEAKLHDSAKAIAESVIQTVVEVCGQKILGSARSKIAAREIIGIAAATTIVEIIEAHRGGKPVWFSLDDNRAFFGLKGKMADTLALRAWKETNGRFTVEMTVVEAKCVSSSAELVEAKSSREQTSATLGTLQANFSEQQDPIAREAWGLSLLQLLSLRPGHIRFFEDAAELEAFRSALARGDTDYQISGKSIIVVHDDVSANADIGVQSAVNDDAVWQYRLGQRALGPLLIGRPDDAEAPKILVPPNATLHGPVSAPVIPDGLYLNPSRSASTEEAQSSNAVTELDAAAVSASLPNPDALTEIAPSVQESFTPDPLAPANSALTPALAKALQRIAQANHSDKALAETKKQAKEIAKMLQAALVEFGMTAALHEPATTTTPNGVLVHFKGHATLTVKKLEPKLLELRTTFGLDLTDIRPGLGRISLFVAARKRQVVDLAQVWLDANWPKTAPHRLANYLVGIREDNGAPLWLNLQGEHGDNDEHSPHTLIAGETGSGKGVLTQNLLLQMIAFNAPSALKLYVIDPKHGVDFAWIKDAPHLARDLVTTQDESGEVLDELVEEMERRYKLFQECGATKIVEYNAKVEPTKQLPLCVVVHDEMADWMASSDDYRKTVQQCFTRLAAKARAAGIHIIMITQRAAQDAVPPGIRDNLGNRLCLKVAGEAGSRLALGQPGAERLLGKGHVAAKLGGDKPDGNDYFIAQVPYATNEILTELAAIVSKDRL